MVMCIFLFALWVVLNGRVTAEICLMGLVLTAAIYAFCVYALGYHPKHERRILRRLAMYAVYIVMLVREIFKANIAVLRVILKKPHHYDPGIVRLRVPLKENISKVFLSNSITLTPGTVTVSQEGDEYLVLCLNKEDAQSIPEWSLVKYLRKVEEAMEK